MGIWLGQERQGFNYGDAGSVRREVEKARGFFRRYRRHPALLMWGLGNEMEGSGDNPVIWRTVNEIARVAKSEDPDHPTMTVIAEAGGRKISQFISLCPDVDVLGINSYGGLATLPKRLADAGLDRPYVITEFGPPGPWEVRKTSWGAPSNRQAPRKPGATSATTPVRSPPSAGGASAPTPFSGATSRRRRRRGSGCSSPRANGWEWWTQ